MRCVYEKGGRVGEHSRDRRTKAAEIQMRPALKTGLDVSASITANSN